MIQQTESAQSKMELDYLKEVFGILERDISKLENPKILAKINCIRLLPNHWCIALLGNKQNVYEWAQKHIREPDVNNDTIIIRNKFFAEKFLKELMNKCQYKESLEWYRPSLRQIKNLIINIDEKTSILSNKEEVYLVYDTNEYKYQGSVLFYYHNRKFIQCQKQIYPKEKKYE